MRGAFAQICVFFLVDGLRQYDVFVVVVALLGARCVLVLSLLQLMLLPNAAMFCRSDVCAV